MRILITFPLSSELQALILSDHVVYRPDLETRSFQALNAYLVRYPTDVLIVRTMPALETLRSWRATTARQRPLTLICLDPGDHPRDLVAPIHGLAVHFVSGPGDVAPEIAAMVVAEEVNNRALEDHRAARQTRALRTAGEQTVTLVGAGIVNLVTAHCLVANGYRVAIYDGMPDPRVDRTGRAHGCTYAGNDARIFSLNESRHHHFKGCRMTAATNRQFDVGIKDGGWLAYDTATDEIAARAWIDAFRKLPPWLAGRFDRDIISFNQESASLWRRMMHDHRRLFIRGGLREGLLRLYTSASQYDASLAKERSIGAIVRELDVDAVAAEFPSLRAAIAGGHVQGALDVVGFSLNIHRFAAALMDDLEQAGATVAWGARVARILRDDHRRIRGLEIAGGSIVTSRHYVLSPGAFGNDLLEGTESEGKLACVAGMWLTLPDDAAQPLDRPLKIARKGFAAESAAEGANVIAGRDCDGKPVIHISSGHGFIGMDPSRFDPHAIDYLAEAVHDTARQFFPTQYREARRRGLLATPHRSCIRPWTPSGLGLFERVEAIDDGLLVITGGHNTGGFAQAPSIAQAVLAALNGRPHPMHALYAPDRFTDFIAQDVALPAQVTL